MSVVPLLDLLLTELSLYLHFLDIVDTIINLISTTNNFIFIIVKLREREGQRVDLGRSLKGHL